MRVIAVSRRDPEPQAIEEAADAIQEGLLVIVPTDTVYGLCASPHCRDALAKVYEVKNRPEGVPLALIVSNLDEVWKLTQGLSATPAQVMREQLPGPVTFVAPRSPETPAGVAPGLATIAIRLPDCKVARAIAARIGPYAATSANLTGEAAPIALADVSAPITSRVGLALDAGPCPVGRPSAVVDLTGDAPVVLRSGPGWETLA